MILDSKKLGIAVAGATALLWFICSALVAFLPVLSMTVAGQMLHADVQHASWMLTRAGFVVGLVAWVVWGFAAGWLIGWIYGLLGGRDPAGV